MYKPGLSNFAHTVPPGVSATYIDFPVTYYLRSQHKCIGMERSVSHERQKAYRLQRHVRGVGHADGGRAVADGRAAADEAVL